MKQFFIIFCIFLSFKSNAENVFQPIIQQIIIKGNKVTKSQIIIRELSFKLNDTIKDVAFHQNQSRQQLLNLFLFNEVEVKIDSFVAQINLVERWYFWPSPKLQHADRNLNQWLLSKDFKRLIYGTDLEWYNFRGRNETIKLKLRLGYTRLMDLNYTIPYFNKKQTWGLNINAQYSDNKEVWFKTLDNKVQFYKDENINLIKRHSFELAAIHRKKIFNYHRFYTGFRQIAIKDTILSDSLNPFYLVNAQNQQQEWFAGYLFTHDKRDFKGYPLKGSMIKVNAELSQFLKQQSSSFYLIKGTFNQYFKLGKRIYNSNSLTLRYLNFNLSSKDAKVPYNKITALGYDRDYIRGYELYVIDGQNFVLGKTELKYQFLNRSYPFLKKVKNYKNIPIALYYTVFSDAGFVDLPNRNIKENSMSNVFQVGYGTGINAVIYYDYLMRLEYSFDKWQNSRFYISFVAAM